MNATNYSVERNFEILNLLHNQVIMKAVSQKAKGKEKTKDNIKKTFSLFLQKAN